MDFGMVPALKWANSSSEVSLWGVIVMLVM